ncbi:MAG: TonB family protein [Nitrospirae bacterium]|nr:TonB family protein [Nitrospirota bacterium]
MRENGRFTDLTLGRFVAYSAGLHLGVVLLFLLFPTLPKLPPPEPIPVQLVEEPAPRALLPPLERLKEPLLSRAGRGTTDRAAPRGGLPRPSPGTGRQEVARAAPGRSVPDVPPQRGEAPAPTTPPKRKGLPFLQEGDLERYAKRETKDRPGEEWVTLDTQEFRYLSYHEKLKIKIESIWEYPAVARVSGLRGNLYIRFTIGKNGNLEEVALVKSSGYRILDEAAVKALKEAFPFLPLPESWKLEHHTIVGNFIYTMDYFYIR